MTGDIVAVEVGRSTWQGPAQDAPSREAEWQPIGTAPKLTRIIVAGWQEPCGGVGGYWWFHEDWTDGTGVPVDHPDASLWIDMKKLLPSLPAAQDRKA